MMYVFVWGHLLYLVQVSVAPCLSISKDSGNNSSLAVILPLLCGWTPLKACQLSRTGHRHKNTCIQAQFPVFTLNRCIETLIL